jgi:hypothetical protein
MAGDAPVAEIVERPLSSVKMVKTVVVKGGASLTIPIVVYTAIEDWASGVKRIVVVPNPPWMFGKPEPQRWESP